MDPVLSKSSEEAMQPWKTSTRNQEHQEIRVVQWIPEMDCKEYHQTEPSSTKCP